MRRGIVDETDVAQGRSGSLYPVHSIQRKAASILASQPTDTERLLGRAPTVDLEINRARIRGIPEPGLVSGGEDI